MRKLLLAALAIIGFLIILFVDSQYRNQIEQDNTRLLELVLLDASEDLELSVTNKLNAVNDLRAFLLLDPDNPNPESFTRFSSTLSENYPHVRAFQYTDTDLFIRYIYPLEGNEAALNLDLKTTTSLPFVEKAIIERTTTISDPVIAAQGPWITVLRAPMYDGDTFFGLAQVVVDINKLASELSIFDSEDVIFQLLDSQNTVMWGPNEITEPSLSSQVIVGDNSWNIKIAWASAPYQPNSLITTFIWGAGSMLTLTLLYTGYQIWWRTQLQATAVAERTGELEQEVIHRAQIEQDLRANQAALARAQNIAGMCSWERDMETDSFTTSEAARAVYGLTPDEDLTLELLESMMPPEDKPARDQYRQRLQEEGQAEFEHRLILRDGTRRWLWLQSQMEYNANGKPVKTVGTSIDITDRKEAELALDRQYKRLSSLHEIDMAIISSLDLKPTLNMLASQIIEQLGVAAVTFLQYLPPLRLEVVARHGFHHAEKLNSSITFGENVAGKVAQTRQAHREQSAPSENCPPNLVKLLKDEGFSSFYALPVIAKGELLGVLELFNKQPFPEDQEWENFLETLIGQSAIAIQNAVLVTNLQRAKQELEIAYDATLEGWVLALDLRDKETEGHTRRVTDTTMVLARVMGVPSEQLVHIRRGALLHDIGKLAVPDEILHKPGPLTEEEWVVMRSHTTYAHNFMKHIDYLHPACDIPFHHHERWDGSGYPDGLKGEEIPLAARIFAIVDVSDALSHDRPYRKAWEPEKVQQHLLEQSGKHFDPDIVTAFMEQVLKLRE